MCRIRSAVWVAALVALGLLVAACGSAGGASTDAGEHHGAHGAHTGEESVRGPVDGAPEVTVNAVDIDFEPTTLQLTAGKPTNVMVVNDGQTLHDFTVEAVDVHVNVEPGQSRITSLTIDESGIYQAVCTVPGHADAGMTIDIVVS